MKKFTSVVWLYLLLCTSAIYAQTTLEAGPNVLQGDGSGNQSWGPDITLTALKINGAPGRLAYESQFTDDGFGVAGGRWLQIDYYKSYQGQTVNASEKFIITFKAPATDVILEVGQLDPNEGWRRAPGRECNDPTGRQKVDESGKYTAYDQNDQVIGSGVLLPSESLEGKLPNSAGGYRFSINAGNQAIKKIVLEATQWGGDEFGCPRYRNNYPDEPTNDSGNKENNSDFNVSGITYTLATNDSEWRVEEDMLQERGEHANAIVNGKLYVMGGIFKSNFGPSEVEVYDFNTEQWSVVSQLPVLKNHFTIGSSVYGDEIWVCGGKLNGSTNSNSGSRSVHVYNTATNTWREGPDLPEDHWAGPSVIIGDKLHVLSGGIGKFTTTAHHFVLDLEDEDAGWDNLKAVPEPRVHAAGVAYGGKIWMIGGELSHAHDGDTKTVQVYDPATDTWALNVPQLPEARSHLEWSTYVYENRIYSVSGVNSANTPRGQETIYVYSDETGKWDRTFDLPGKLVSPGAKVYQDRMYVFGGGVNDWFEGDLVSVYSREIDNKSPAPDPDPTPGNRQPVANDDNPDPVKEDIGLTGFSYDAFLANDTDPDGDDLQITSFDFSNFPGTIEDNQLERTIEFRTAVNFNGEIEIPYTVSDGRASDTGIITLTISDVPDNLTIGQDGPFTTDKDTPVTIAKAALLSNDTAIPYLNSPVEIVLDAVGSAVNGSVALQGDDVVFTPASNFTGQASFTYSLLVLNDGFGPPRPVDQGTSAAVVVNVTGDATEIPSINQKAVIVAKANPDFTLQVNDTDNQTSAVVEACDEQGQVWTISDRGNGFHKIVNDFANKALEAWQPTPANGDDVTIYKSNNKNWQQWELIAAGDGYFKIKGKYNQRLITLSDGNAVMLNENGQDEQLWQLVAPSAVTCDDAPANNPPVAVEDGDFSDDPDYTLTVGETLVIPFSRLLANDSDPDGDPLTIVEVQFIRNGNPVIVGNTVEFTGVDAGEGALFGYTISDGRGGLASTTVSLDILDAPSLDPVVLEASSLQANGGTEPLAWGSCAEITAFSASGTSAAITLRRGRAGVQGNRSNTQLDYDPVSNTSERLEINFNQFVGQVSFTLGNLETDEWQDADETGTWALLDDNGTVLSQGRIAPNAGAVQGSSVYGFSTSYSGGVPTKLVLEATAYDSGNGPDRTDNNSDYSLISVAYTPVESTCYKNIGAASTAVNAPIVYPTTVQNTINVKTDEGSAEQVIDVVIYDNSGVVVEKVSAKPDQKTFEVKDTKEGLYFVRVITSEGQYSYKVIKE
jgi:N-acetylneuraminic acid mutarotase